MPFIGGDYFLEPSDAGRVGIQDFDFPPAHFGVARIHPEKVRNEKGRLLASGSGPDFQDDVLVVIGVLGGQHELELVFGRVELIFQAADFIPDQLAHLRVFFPLKKSLVFLHLLFQFLVVRVLLHYRGEFGALPGHLLVLFLIAQQIRVAEILFELLKFLVLRFPACQTFDPLASKRSVDPDETSGQK